jgi:hypothetical protein
MTSLTRFIQKLYSYLSKKDTPIFFEASPEVAIVEEIFDDETESDISNKLQSMTKAEIDMYAEEHGIILDRRQTKFNMITEFIQKLKEKS